jgi:LemA protein
VIPMKVSTPQIRARAVLALLAASLLLPGCSYNRFVSDEEAIKQAWSEVQNQLQRRTDLIPNLVETVKGIAGQEQEVFGRIAEQSSALARLLAVVENYPQLRSSESFNRLMDELAGTENRLSVARMRYNERIQQFNTLRRRFPSNIVAGVFGFKEYPYFEAPPEARQVPKVEFGK